MSKWERTDDFTRQFAPNIQPAFFQAIPFKIPSARMTSLFASPFNMTSIPASSPPAGVVQLPYALTLMRESGAAYVVTAPVRQLIVVSVAANTVGTNFTQMTFNLLGANNFLDLANTQVTATHFGAFSNAIYQHDKVDAGGGGPWSFVNKPLALSVTNAELSGGTGGLVGVLYYFQFVNLPSFP